MKKKLEDLTLKEIKKYCDDRRKTKNENGTCCNGCPLIKICGEYIDTIDEELEIEINIKENK